VTVSQRASLLALLGLIAVTSACYHFAQLAALVRPRGDSDAPALYLDRCATCHGAAGRGDGLAGRGLDPPPRDFGDAAWQAATSDERIRFVIKNGAEAAGLSSTMAAHPELTEDEIEVLVRYLRESGSRRK
jgi:mono/diheme cytochrome c family protein